MSMILTAVIVLIAAFIGFKILKFVASMIIKMVLFFAIMGVAAYIAIRMLW